MLSEALYLVDNSAEECNPYTVVNVMLRFRGLIRVLIILSAIKLNKTHWGTWEYRESGKIYKILNFSIPPPKMIRLWCAFILARSMRNGTKNIGRPISVCASHMQFKNPSLAKILAGMGMRCGLSTVAYAVL